MEDNFERQIQRLRQRLYRLSQQVEVAEEPEQLVQETVTQLSNALEELHVAEEELRAQNDELRAMRMELEAEQQRYQALFDFAPGGYLVTDRQGVIKEANRAASTLLGLSKSYLQGKPLAVFVPEADHPTFYTHLSDARSGEDLRLSPFEIRLEPREGSPFHASITVAQGQADGQTGETLRWLIRDVTPRVEAQRALEQRELRLQILNQIATDLIARQSLDEIVQQATHRLATALPDVRAAYCTLDDEHQLCVQHTAEHPEMPSREDLQVDLGPAPEYRKKLQWGQHIASEDVTRDDRLAPLADFHAEGGSRATLDVPVKQWDELTGLLCLDAPRPHSWSDFEINLLTDIANQLSTAFRQMHIERERNRIERGLVSSEALLREAQRLGRIGSWSYDVLADEITWSEMMYVLYERPPVQGPPADFEDNLCSLYPPEEAARLRTAVERAIAEAEPYELDLKVHLSSGETAYHHAIGTPVTNRTGRVVELRGTAQDVTERKTAEATLRRHQERLEALHRADRAILEASAPADIATSVIPYLREIKADMQLAITTFDYEAGEMTVLAAHVHDADSPIVPGASIGLEHIWFLNKLQTGGRYTEENLSAFKKESPLADILEDAGVEAFTIFPLIAQHVLLGALNVALPSTQAPSTEVLEAFEAVATQLAIGLQQVRLRKALRAYNEELQEMVERRTASLRATEARFRATFEGAAVGIAQLTGAGEIIEANRALARLLGCDRSELAGRQFTDFLQTDDVDRAIEHYRALLAGRRDYYRQELQMRCATGEVLDTQVTISALAETDDHPQFAIAMVEDITEQKIAQTELIRAEKLAITGRLAASLAHEINNPLQTVIGALGLTREVLVEGGDATRYLDISMRELERAARIVADLRNLNRPARLEERELTPINRLLQDVLTLTEKRCQNRGIDVVWEPAPSDPQVFIVQDRMQQVFLNLVLNAIEAMPEGGRLTVTAVRTEEPPGVRVQVSDTGVGIAPEEQARLFEAFYTTKADGVGLGLYVTARIVEDHGGDLSVESQVGHGTTFTVWLPDAPD